MKSPSFRNIVLAASLAANLIGLCAFAFHRRAALAGLLTYAAVGGDVDAKLGAMNRGPGPGIESGCVPGDSGRTVRLLVLGNSIAFHHAAPEIGWTNAWGMAASSADSDYVHRLARHVHSASGGARVEYVVFNMAQFERNFATYDTFRLDSVASAFHPGIVLFQIGDNVKAGPNQNWSLFERRYTGIVSRFKESHRFVASPFFGSPERNLAAEHVAATTGSFLVDLSHLAVLDKTNQASSEHEWRVKGVGLHPGDKGMASIARQFAVQIDAAVFAH